MIYIVMKLATLFEAITEFPEPLDDNVIELTGLFDTETEFIVPLREIVMELLLHCDLLYLNDILNNTYSYSLTSI